MTGFKAGNVPRDMREARRWIPVKGKRPLVKAWNVPDNWQDFQDAAETSRPFPGFVLGGGFYCLDYDNVGENLAPASILEGQAGETYTERSQSGKGLHAFYKADIPADFPDTLKLPLDGGGVLEVYTGTGRGRFIAVTGHTVGNTTTLADGTALLDFLREKAGHQQGAVNGNTLKPCIPADEWPLPVDEIPGRIRKSKQGRKFKALFDDGDIEKGGGGDPSRADERLMSMLPFWCGGNPEIMEAVFSLSALAQREKWKDRADYRQRTVNYALDRWDGTLYRPAPTAQDDFDPLEEIPAPCWPVVDSKGHPLRQVWENTAYLLAELGISCRYNVVSKQVEFNGGSLEGKSLEAAGTAILSLALRNGLNVSKNALFDNLNLVSEANKYSPVRDYLTACMDLWDGKDHIEALFQKLHIAPERAGRIDLYRKLFRLWIISAVRMAFNEGEEAAQGVLVLQGGQGIGKSRFVQALVPEKSWTAGGRSLDPALKDDLIAALGYWIVELGEIGESIRKERVDRLKQFLTQNIDVLRLPYARTASRLPRTTVFIGTVNGSGFLKDNSGERRYWVLPLASIDPIDVDLAQLWGQAARLALKDNARYWLTSEEVTELNGANEPFKRLTDEEVMLLEALDWEAPVETWTKKTSRQISYLIGLDGRRLVMIGKALNRLASMDSRIEVPTNNHREYLTPPQKGLDE